MNYTVLISIALLLAVALCSLYMLSAKYGEGLHIQYLQPANVPAYSQVLLLEGLFYGLCQMFIKLSYLALYLRLAPDTTYRIILYGLVVLVTLFGISTSIASMLLCIPFKKAWQPDIPGTCIKVYPFYISFTALNMVFDLAIFILPIPILLRLHLPRRQRVGLACIFGLGLMQVVLVASIARLQAMVNLFSAPSYESDNTWTTVNLIIWSAVEIHLGLLISCTAAFKALIQRFYPGFLGSTRSTHLTQFSTRFTLNGQDGGHVLQSRNGDETKFGTATRANVTEVTKTGSQEHIIDDVEMATFENTDSIHSPSKASTDGSALGSHSVGVTVST
ncbi:hypothetical protein V8E51_019517 [Hyaloscypha variabilis]